MNNSTIALIVLGTLGALVIIGLGFGDLGDTEAAWAALGAVIGAVGGILAPTPKD